MDGIANNTLTLIDVRPLNEFKFGHIPGAINAPIDELESIISKLPRSAEIVAYCRGPYCTFSHQAVLILSKLGYSIRRYDEGLPQWRAYGFPVEVE
ncbi:rhodanese-like domain-containing protein [Reinekea marina]|uniref:Rhodanese-like domain-containing protein n=1 Tax=Reinekea marina TaxID=1310421 RepID=A0ABV7WSI9_9GAMM|nr:rhodanese-like domain-containing protein [Reinekea marina]MDN3648976.1 rhodanese-like domain-containing protein [Reinekea marina]